MLLECAKKAEKNPLRQDSLPSQTALREGKEVGSPGLVPTRATGHAAEITRMLVEEAGLSSALHLIITAG